ncbi:hypothetical protein IFM89_031630 [Coptis chinensis]|uniref:Uncharacterized protein n=1 Tax=Coptis chinensis TaxID=261450 RepID=A0A835HA55_9MAGN|nr:hypothetical protein IFM89_031630 [Coptis chinensis]
MKTPLPQYKEDAIALVHVLMGVFDIEHTLEVNKTLYPTKIRHAMLLAGFSDMCGKLSEVQVGFISSDMVTSKIDAIPHRTRILKVDFPMAIGLS